MQPAFNNPPIQDTGVLYHGRPLFKLHEPLRFNLNMTGDGGGIAVIVPQGCQTDFASIPRILWPIFPPWGKYTRAAILHDYLYSSSGKCSRFLADALFRDAMRELGVPVWKRVVMYYAVRLFGHLAWYN